MTKPSEYAGIAALAGFTGFNVASHACGTPHANAVLGVEWFAVLFGSAMLLARGSRYLRGRIAQRRHRLA